ncbi:HAD family hydrolase [Lysinibacillus sp. 54212]|uniref:HAD family hydrolase n=1 Tax=Lysinibacillus sp. 54212 TaxID=3119829 RepID=UPI002FCB50E8
MEQYKVILFDLDGTLSDPKIGITKSVQYALGKLGINEPDLDKLEPFIGPPLQVSFREFYQFDETLTNEAIMYYRERFKVKGMFENKIYEGIPQLLASLKARGYRLGVATSKATVFADEIVKYFDIEGYFDIVAGSFLDGTRTAKGEVIAYATEHFPQVSPQQFIMIGDRKYDMIGAHENGIACIGVTFGYGSYEELQEAKATKIVNSVSELEQLFIREL